MISIISFLIVISVCVISHEGGHYLAARWRNVMIHEFAFGMGKSIWSVKKGETLWSLRALPIGGFVKLEGEDGDDENGEKPVGFDPSRSLSAKKPWERFVIIAAGATVNLLLAWLLTAALLAGNGILDTETATIGAVIDGTPAKTMELKAGDVIYSINGVELKKWDDIKTNIQKDSAGDKFAVTVKRGDAFVNYYAEIPFNEEHGGRLLGVQPAMVKYPVHIALAKGLSYSWRMGLDIMRGLWMVLTRQIQADVTGPVGIAVMAGDAVKRGFWSFVAFLGVINLNLGLLNLLPFPALDGGRLIFILIELVTRRKVPEKWEGYVHYGGFIVLIALILLVTGQDIIRLFN